MTKPPEMPVLNLAAMPIADLARLMDVALTMFETTLSFLSQPRFVKSPSEDFVDAMSDGYFAALAEVIYNELEGRTPTTSQDAEDRGKALIKYLGQGDAFHDMLRICSETIQGMSKRAA